MEADKSRKHPAFLVRREADHGSGLGAKLARVGWEEEEILLICFLVFLENEKLGETVRLRTYVWGK